VTVPVTVYFFDTDAAAVVHNVAYLRMVEVARTRLAEVCGWAVPAMLEGEHGCPVVARTEADYLRPARLGDPLEITARLTRLEKVRFYVTTEIRRQGEETVLCRAVQTLVAVDLKSGRPKALRPDWIARWPELAVPSSR
jgi:YbgC/YbaW family acyl-CoA thioester hydrolase